MRTPLLPALAFWSAVTLCPLVAAEKPAGDGAFTPLFNGRDLTGWTNVNCAPETWSVRDGMIVCTGKPIGALRTTRQYENFILEVEWRHLTSGGNSGVFVWGSAINAPGVPFLRGIEVQALDHGYAVQYEQRTGKKPDFFTVHGDVFPIHGATMTPIGRTNGRRGFPSEDRSRPSPEWNHYRIVANNGSIRLHVNGKEVSGGDNCNYRKGYLALESEGAPVEFRNLRIQELPPTGAGPENTAPLDPGWRSLFNGLDFRGWKTSAAWEIAGEKLQLKADAGSAAEAPLWTTADFGDAEFNVDYQAPKAPKAPATVSVFVRGAQDRGIAIALPPGEPGKFSRFTVTVRGAVVQVARDGQRVSEVQLPAGTPARGAFGLAGTPGGGVVMNLHAREL